MASMEVPGRSMYDPNPHQLCCQPCTFDGITEAAEMYCKVCREFLCSKCVSFHRRARLLRSHHLIDKDSLLTETMEPLHENNSEYCEEHPNELIKYYCPTHESLYCADCYILDYHKCKMELVTKMAAGFKDAESYKKFKSSISKLTDDFSTNTSELERMVNANDDNQRKDTKQVLEFQAHIVASLNETFKHITAQVASANQDSKAILSDLQTRSKAAGDEATSLKDYIDGNEDNNVLLFISTLRSQIKMGEVSHKLQQIIAEQELVPKYEFVRNEEAETSLENPSWIGVYRKVCAERCTEGLGDKDGKYTGL